MSEYNAKNYTEQGGDVTHIGGTLEFGEGAEVKNFPGGGYTLPSATITRLGGIKVGEGLLITEEGVLSVEGITPVPNMPNTNAATLSDLVINFNALLTAMKSVGIMASDPEG